MENLVSIRMAVPEDAEGILDVYAPYIKDSNITFEYTVPDIREFQARIETILQDMPYIVCSVDGEIAGYAYASHYRNRAAYQWDCELSVYVKEDFQRAGIGRRLYEMLLSLLKEMHYVHAYACITTPNPQSIGFHTSMGFEKTAVFQKCGYKDGSWLDVTWMDKILTEDLTVPNPIRKCSDLPGEVIENLFSAYENELETALQNDIMICKSFLGL